MKKILSIFMATVMILSIIPVSLGQNYAYNLTDFTIKKSETGYSATLSVSDNGIAENGVVLMSFYSESGKLLKVAYENVDKLENGVMSENIVLSDGQTLGNVKAYVWNSLSGMTPLSEVAAAEEITEKYAVIDKYKKSSTGDNYIATLYNTDGKVTVSEIDTTKTSMTNAEILELVYLDVDQNGIISSEEVVDDNKTGIENRVVAYKISSSGRIVDLVPMPAEVAHTTLTSYTSSTKSLGEIKMDENTAVIDAIEYCSGDNVYSELEINSISGFVNGKEYTAFAFGFDEVNEAYRFVIVTSAGGKYTYETNFAVVTKAPVLGYDDETGNDIYKMEAFYEGYEYTDDEDLIISHKASVLKNGLKVNPEEISRGDIVVFVQDRKGIIKQIDVLLKASDYGFDESSSRIYESITDTLLAGGTDTKINLPTESENWTVDWNENNAKDASGNRVNYAKKVTQFAFGAIVDKDDDYFTLASFGNADKLAIDDGTEYTGAFSYKYEYVRTNNDGGIIDIDIDSDTKVYVYDTTKGAKTARFSLGGTGDIAKTLISKSSLLTTAYVYDLIPWDMENSDMKSKINFAFAKIVEGTATDVFLILGNTYNG